MMTLFHFHVHMILVYMTLKVSPFTLKNFLNHRLVRKTWCQQVHSSMSHHVHCLLGKKRLIWYPEKINKFIAGKYGQLDSLSAILFCMICSLEIYIYIYFFFFAHRIFSVNGFCRSWSESTTNMDRRQRNFVFTAP